MLKLSCSLFVALLETGHASFGETGHASFGETGHASFGEAGHASLVRQLAIGMPARF